MDKFLGIELCSFFIMLFGIGLLEVIVCHAIWMVVALDLDSKSDFSLWDVVDFKMIGLRVLLVFGLFLGDDFPGLGFGAFWKYLLVIMLNNVGLWTLVINNDYLGFCVNFK